MKCPYCGNEISKESELIGSRAVKVPGGKIEVCGRCHILLAMLQTLQGIKEKME